MREYEKYYQSEEFKEILQRYERALQGSEKVYFDESDMLDISDYYLNNNDLDNALFAADLGISLHPQSEDLLLSRANALLFQHRYEEVEALISNLHETPRYDILFLQAQIQCGRGLLDDADYQFEEWTEKQEQLFARNIEGASTSSRTEEEMEDEEDYEDDYSEEELRDAYLHVAMSFDQLCEEVDEQRVSIYLRHWIEEYIDRFHEMGQFDADLDLAHLAQDWDFAEEQETIFKRLLDSDPYLKDGWASLAEAQEMCGKYAEAQESADFALAINPKDGKAIKVKGLSLFCMENYRDALPFLQQLRNRGLYDLTPQLAYCYLAEGNKANTERYLQECVDWIEEGRAEGYTNEDIAQFYDIIADVYRAEDECEKALEFVEKAIKLDPKEMEYRMLKGEILLCTGKEVDALNTFVSILGKTKTIPRDLYRIGVIYFTYDYFYMARCFLEVAVEMHKKDIDFPELADTYAYLSITNWSLGNTETAIGCLREATKRSPKTVKKVFAKKLPDSLADADVFDYIKKNLILKKRRP